MKITETGLAITSRFFQALDMLIANKTIRGLKEFTDEYDINRRNLVSIRKLPNERHLRPEYLSWLVTGYNVNPNWLLTGKGGMFNNKTK